MILSNRNTQQSFRMWLELVTIQVSIDSVMFSKHKQAEAETAQHLENNAQKD